MDFYKYQGTGNDFILIDNRNLSFPKENTKLVNHLCQRRFGIGADGLILLENDAHADFKMVYYNSDGSQSTMCGNGGRCIVAFAKFLGIIDQKTTFNAVDGLHQAKISEENIKLKMIDVDSIKTINNDYELNTGSLHYVKYVEDIVNHDVFKHGNEIRNSDTYYMEGINVNFVSKLDDNNIFVRTFERGVEDETYSCGTGVTASALTFMQNNNLTRLKVKTLGGDLVVYAEKAGNGFKNIWLEGPAEFVFKGFLDI